MQSLATANEKGTIFSPRDAEACDDVALSSADPEASLQSGAAPPPGAGTLPGAGAGAAPGAASADGAGGNGLGTPPDTVPPTGAGAAPTADAVPPGDDASVAASTLVRLALSLLAKSDGTPIPTPPLVGESAEITTDSSGGGAAGVTAGSFGGETFLKSVPFLIAAKRSPLGVLDAVEVDAGGVGGGGGGGAADVVPAVLLPAGAAPPAGAADLAGVPPAGDTTKRGAETVLLGPELFGI